MVFPVSHSQMSLSPGSAFDSDQAKRRSFAPHFVWAMWGLCTIGVYVFLARFAVNIPWHDDWILLWAYDKGTSIWAWMWRQQNEHRFPISKAVLFLVYKLTHHDSRVCMCLNVTVFVALSAALIVVTGRKRGRTVWADALFPLVLLSGAQYWNFLMSIQLFVISAAALQCLAIVFVYAGAYRSRRGILCFGPVFALLPLHAGNGMSALPPLLVFLLLAGWFRRREATRRGRVDALLLFAFAALAGLLALLYMVGYVPQKQHLPPNSLAHFLVTTAQYLCVSVGLALIQEKLWLWALIPTTLMLVTTTILSVTSLARDRGKDGGLEAAGYLLCLLFILVSAILVGYGRSRLGEYSGLSHRFVSMLVPLPILVYLAWDSLPLSARTRSFARNTLFILFLVLMPLNSYQGVRHADFRRAKLEAMLSDIQAGVPARQVAARHYQTVFPGYEKHLASYLEIMEQKRLGPYYP